MRPPEFTGGNSRPEGFVASIGVYFNEAAGIHRRKPRRTRCVHDRINDTSMRPPEFTGGNDRRARQSATASSADFNEAAGIHRRKPGAMAPIKTPGSRLQ